MSKTDMKFKMLKIYQNLFQNNFERVGVTEKTRLVNCRRWAKGSRFSSVFTLEAVHNKKFLKTRKH